MLSRGPCDGRTSKASQTFWIGRYVLARCVLSGDTCDVRFSTGSIWKPWHGRFPESFIPTKSISGALRSIPRVSLSCTLKTHGEQQVSDFLRPMGETRHDSNLISLQTPGFRHEPAALCERSPGGGSEVMIVRIDSHFESVEGCRKADFRLSWAGPSKSPTRVMTPIQSSLQPLKAVGNTVESGDQTKGGLCVQVQDCASETVPGSKQRAWRSGWF